jgi:type II secretory pathway pseudopilin PulG
VTTPRARRSRAGLTLLEGAVIFAVIGGVLAAFLPVFFREIRTSKSAEASHNLEHLHQLAAAYFEARHMNDEGRYVRRCLPESAGPAPEIPSKKPTAVDFTAENVPGRETFAVLGFRPAAVRFRYSLVSHRAGCNLEARGKGPDLELIAEGDLDGDGARSTFVRGAIIDPDGKLVPYGPLRVRNRTE